MTTTKWKCDILSSAVLKRPSILYCIKNYLGTFSPSTADIYKPLRTLMSVKCEWTWKSICQKFYESAKSFTKKMHQWNSTMKKNSCILKQMQWVSFQEQVFSRWWMECGSLRTRHLTTVANSMCKQKLDQCQDMAQQHQNRCSRHTPWTREIPPILFCPQG